jgi:hypothetical protein
MLRCTIGHAFIAVFNTNSCPTSVTNTYQINGRSMVSRKENISPKILLIGKPLHIKDRIMQCSATTIVLMENIDCPKDFRTFVIISLMLTNNPNACGDFCSTNRIPAILDALMKYCFTSCVNISRRCGRF